MIRWTHVSSLARFSRRSSYHSSHVAKAEARVEKRRRVTIVKALPLRSSDLAYQSCQVRIAPARCRCVIFFRQTRIFSAWSMSRTTFVCQPVKAALSTACRILAKHRWRISSCFIRVLYFDRHLAQNRTLVPWFWYASALSSAVPKNFWRPTSTRKRSHVFFLYFCVQ